jgi:hypothetical protein
MITEKEYKELVNKVASGGLNEKELDEAENLILEYLEKKFKFNRDEYQSVLMGDITG